MMVAEKGERKLEDHIGQVLVKLHDDVYFYAKVKIIGFKQRAEANIAIPKKDLVDLGAKTMEQAEFVLSTIPSYILSLIKKQKSLLVY